MTADPFVCLSCGFTCPHRQCVWVYRLGPGNSGFSCPSCYAPAWRTELEEQWPQMPLDLEGVDLFSQYPITGAPEQ